MENNPMKKVKEIKRGVTEEKRPARILTPTEKLKLFCKKLVPYIKFVLILTMFVMSYELSNRFAIIVENTDLITKERIINICLVALLFIITNKRKK